MPALLGNIIVILILLGAVTLIVRSMWKSHKNGSGCSGDCAHCGGCGGGKKSKVS